MNEEYRKYWNDLEIEKRKPYYITTKHDQKLLRWLREETKLERCLRDALAYSHAHFGGISGQVLDVGAGVCWSSAILADISSVEQVTAIEYSENRLNLIAPVVFEQFSTDLSKLRRILGDFLEYSFAENSFDVILFCQSLYMFPDLNCTLKKVFSLLKPGGHLVVACERLVGSSSELLKKRRVRELLSIYKRLILVKCGFIKSGIYRDASGKLSYEDRHYRQSISRAGLVYHYQLLDYTFYPDIPVLAGNHFGLKLESGIA